MEKIFPLRMRKYIACLSDRWREVQEIRLRSDKPVLVTLSGKEWMFDLNGGLVRESSKPLCATPEDIGECMAYLCEYSLYAYEDELRQGFITIRGGHRIGICGQVVLKAGELHSISHVASLNIRVSHEILGCAEPIFEKLWDGENPCHCLIISPPGCGKTTLLRDMIRLFSDGTRNHAGQTVGVVDERSEIAACFMGIPQNRVGRRTDVLSHCPKALGVEMLVRSMAPKLIAFDELGNARDMKAVRYALHSGCYVLTTIHGKRLNDELIYRTGGVFERYILLNNWSAKQRIAKILDRQGNILCEAG